ncbi:MAG: hypothetical protein IPG60_06675 [Bacteroidetes bacterium]|nr:hypothetical protein [Bacteroidota bacterium]
MNKIIFIILLLASCKIQNIDRTDKPCDFLIYCEELESGYKVGRLVDLNSLTNWTISDTLEDMNEVINIRFMSCNGDYVFKKKIINENLQILGEYKGNEAQLDTVYFYSETTFEEEYKLEYTYQPLPTGTWYYISKSDTIKIEIYRKGNLVKTIH